MSSNKKHRLFLQWTLINVLFLLAVGMAIVTYGGRVELAGEVASGIVLLVYLAASGWAGWLAWKYPHWWRKEKIGHLSFAIEVSPMIAMLGTVGGFLIAFGSSAGDIQHRVIGASTGLAATFVGISCTVVLMVIRHLLLDKS